MELGRIFISLAAQELAASSPFIEGLGFTAGSGDAAQDRTCSSATMQRGASSE